MPLIHSSFARAIAEARRERYKRDRSTDTRKSHVKSGKHISKFKAGHFIAWDGEGITDPNRPDVLFDGNAKVQFQNYALLMNNEGVEKVNMNGLTTVECLRTILDSTNDPKAIHVVFGGSYDMNMFFRDIPQEFLVKLQKGESIDYKEFSLKYRPRKSLEIREFRDPSHRFMYNAKLKKWMPDYKKSVTLWDVFSFFGDSFVTTLDKWFVHSGNPVTSEKYKAIIEQIAKGKQLRGTFNEPMLHAFVKPYCKLEVDALHELMVTLHGYLNDADLVLARWDGAGACAAALMKKYHVKEHISLKDVPSEVVRASEYAFFGGRIETLKYGNYEKPVYHYDINSAYPYALSLLPSLKDGHWRNIKGPQTPDMIHDAPMLSMFLVSWDMHTEKTLIAPFPWRSKTGNVYFPPYGKSWVYKPELEMCIDTFVGKYNCDIVVEESWEFTPTIDEKPFWFVHEQYAIRQRLIKEGSGAEKIFKLGPNSLYGKTAQSLGYDAKLDQKPPYHNLVIAGWVTSFTRAKMMRAAMQHPESIIMLATDGIYSTKALDVESSTEKVLGQWEAKVHDYITIVASGVYWYKSNDKENSYSRGFDKYTIMRDMVIDAWNRHEVVLPCESTRFVSLGGAIGLNNFDLWCTWRTVYRELGLNMDRVAKRDSSSTRNPSRGLISTTASIPAVLAFATSFEKMPFDSRVALSNKYSFDWDTQVRIDGLKEREYLEDVVNGNA